MKTARTKAEGQKWLGKMQLQLGQAYEKSASLTTVQEYLEGWLESIRLNLRSKTVHHYELTVRNHILPYIGTTRLGDQSSMQVEKLYAHLHTSGKGIRTIRLTHAVLHSALGKAVRLRLIGANPATGATLPRLKQAKFKSLISSRSLVSWR